MYGCFGAAGKETTGFIRLFIFGELKMQQQEISQLNPYIHQMRRTLQQHQPGAVDWLVLAHNDSQLLSRVNEAFPHSVLAVIALPQSHWQLDEQRISEAVDWAIQELGVKGVLLVGHSQGEMAEEPIRLLGGKSKTRMHQPDIAAKSNSLLDRVRKTQLRAESLQRQLAGQIEKLCRLTAVQTHMIRHHLQLHGLFYRAESGVFYAYDLQQRNFRPLLNEATA
jgi:carbonic anhydrase